MPLSIAFVVFAVASILAFNTHRIEIAAAVAKWARRIVFASYLPAGNVIFLFQSPIKPLLLVL
jgi:hypothetical protein